MKTYKVKVCRTAEFTVEVEAENDWDAGDQAFAKCEDAWNGVNQALENCGSASSGKWELLHDESYDIEVK